VGISRIGRDFQGAASAVFSTVSFRFLCHQQVWPPTDRDLTVKVFANRDRATSERVSKARLTQLEIAVLQHDGVIVSDGSLRLKGEHAFQVLAGAFTECRPFLGSRFREPAIELGNIVLA
jgi:hypothetical protein